MTHETLFTSYEPIEHYLQLIETTTGNWPMPPVRIQELDVYLLSQLFARYPLAPAVVDCSAGFTWGTSTVLCLDAINALSSVVSVGPSVDENFDNQQLHFDWATIIRHLVAIDDERHPAGFHFLPENHFYEDTDIQHVRQHLPLNMPKILLMLMPDEPDVLRERVLQLVSHFPKALFIVGPIYRSNESAHLISLMELKQQHGFEFCVLREENTFMMRSEIALVYKEDHPINIPDIISSMKLMFEGNFDFLPLLEANLVLQQSNMRYKQQVEQLTHEVTQVRKNVIAGGVSAHEPLPVRMYQAIMPLSVRRRFRFRQRLVGLYQRIVPLSVRTRRYNARHNK